MPISLLTHLLEPRDKFRTLQPAPRFLGLLPKLKILVSVAVLEPQYSDFRHEGVLRLEVVGGGQRMHERKIGRLCPPRHVGVAR
jgi:hypothetical protein